MCAGSDAKDDSSADSASGSLIARLRRDYRLRGSSLSVAGLATLWLHQALQEGRAQGRHGLSGRDLQALALRVAQQLQDLHLKSWKDDGDISEEEYVHAMLLLKAQDRAASQIYAPLKASLAKYPNMLLNLQNLFDRADSRGCAFLSRADVARMYRHRSWRLHPSCMDGRPLTDEELEDPEDLARQLVEAMDIDLDGMVSYSEFVAFCVGRRKKEVKLHLYDLSRGSGGQFKWLLGESMAQIWHTGVVAFDKEYFFSSDTIFDSPGKTSFGEPSQVRSLGYTFWNQDELHDFIVSELKPIFHRDTYDVICNNCNHFSDRVSMYLTGTHLPEDIRIQSDQLMDLVSVRAVRPFLNWLLRDCVVSRDGTARPVDVPHGKWHRITTCEEVVPGAVVALHPEWGRTAGALGIVCDARETEASFQRRNQGIIDLPYLSCGTYSCMPQGICCESHTRLVAPDGDMEVCVKFMEVTLQEQKDGLCACRLQTQRVPVHRLSLVTMDGTTFGIHYREAMECLTQQLVTKPGLRSVWTLNEKSGAFGRDGESPGGQGGRSFDSHEVPALDPIQISHGDPTEFQEEVEEGSMVEA